MNLNDYAEEIEWTKTIIKASVSAATDKHMDNFIRNWFDSKSDLIDLFGGELRKYISCDQQFSGEEPVMDNIFMEDFTQCYASRLAPSLLYNRDTFHVAPKYFQPVKDILKSVPPLYLTPKKRRLDYKPDNIFYSINGVQTVVVHFKNICIALINSGQIDYENNLLNGMKVNKILKGLKGAARDVNDDIDTMWSMYLDKRKVHQGDVIVSIAPSDYLLMSEGNSWDSCHRLRTRARDNGGEYLTGPFSLAQDSSTIVCYKLSDTPHTLNGLVYPTRTWRSLAYVDIYNRSAMFSRHYPHTNHHNGKASRSLIMNLIADHHGIEGKWVKSPGYGNTEPNAFEYTSYFYDDARRNDDYDRIYSSICILKDNGASPSCSYGEIVKCFHCGDALGRPSSLLCGDCRETLYTQCRGCSGSFPKERIKMHNNTALCLDCYSRHIITCEHCEQEMNSSTVFSARDETGRIFKICASCMEDYFVFCNSCNIAVHNELAKRTSNSNNPYCVQCVLENNNLGTCDRCGQLHSHPGVGMFCDHNFNCNDCPEESAPEETEDLVDLVEPAPQEPTIAPEEFTITGTTSTASTDTVRQSRLRHFVSFDTMLRDTMDGN